MILEDKLSNNRVDKELKNCKIRLHYSLVSAKIRSRVEIMS